MIFNLVCYIFHIWQTILEIIVGVIFKNLLCISVLKHMLPSINSPLSSCAAGNYTSKTRFPYKCFIFIFELQYDLNQGVKQLFIVCREVLYWCFISILSNCKRLVLLCACHTPDTLLIQPSHALPYMGRSQVRGLITKFKPRIKAVSFFTSLCCSIVANCTNSKR